MRIIFTSISAHPRQDDRQLPGAQSDVADVGFGPTD
jgi:hypothetical protein